MQQHPVPERLLIHIGDITVSFAVLENAIQMLIGSFIAEHQRIGQIITAELAFKSLRALAISLYKERHGEDDDFKLLQELMTRAASLESIRNQITHSLWAAGNSPDTITRIKLTAKERHGIRFQSEGVDEKYLSEIARDLKVLAGDVLSFYIRLIEAGKAINNPGKKIW